MTQEEYRNREKKDIERNKEIIRRNAENIINGGNIKIELKIHSHVCLDERMRGIAIYVNGRLVDICYPTYRTSYKSVLDSVINIMDVLESFALAVA